MVCPHRQCIIHTCIICRSYSWSVNICGQKEWLLVPPGQEQVLSATQGSLPADISPADKLARVPGTVRVLQGTGEAIFVPRYQSLCVHAMVCYPQCNE